MRPGTAARVTRKRPRPMSESQPETEFSDSSASEYADSSEEETDEEVVSGADDLDSGDDMPPIDIDSIDFDPTVPQASEDLEQVCTEIQDFNDSNGLGGPDAGHDDPPSDVDSIDEELYGGGNLAPPEFYRQKIKNINVDDFKRKHYAKGTLKLIANVENYWRAFCMEVPRPRRRDHEQYLREINFNTIYAFLYWYLNQKKGPSGRSKRRVRAMGTLIAFWCCLRLHYERVTTHKIDDKFPRGVINNGLVDLGKKFKLSHEKRENRSMTLDDLKLQIEHTLCTTMKDFKMGEVRVLAVLFLLLLAPQGSRPQSILDIKFKDISILLIRNPEDPKGLPRLTIRLRLSETKTYQGVKPIKTFLVPEIMYDPSLLISPHVFLLAILFRNRAFASESLNNNPWLINTLQPSPTANQLRLVLRDDIADCFLFRRCVKGITGYKMSTNLPITQDMTGKWIRTIGKQLGFEHNTIAYNLRYFAGNSLDQSVNISSALRNLILDHAPNSDTFQKHYLNRNVCADLWAIHRAKNPQQALLQQATSHGGSRDSRRKWKLTEADVEQVKRDPRYQRLTKQLEDKTLGWRSDKRKQLTLTRRNLLNKLKARRLKETVEEWGKQQDQSDIELQARGEGFPGSSKQSESSPPMSDVQREMFEALTSPLVNDIDAQLERRTKAVLGIVAYCAEEEPLRTSLLDLKKPAPPREFETNQSFDDQVREAHKSSLASVMGTQVRRCFICISMAVKLGRDHPRFVDLLREFSSALSLARHFTSIHLDGFAEDDQFECPQCQVQLIHKNHLRLHAHTVHGINTHRKRKMRYTGE